MKYVIDSSVAFKRLVPEVDTDKALRLRDDFLNGIVDLVAPDVFSIEVVHALTRAERQQRVTPAQGAQQFLALLKTLPKLFPHLALLPRAYELSSTLRVGVYDCLYVALAEQEKCELVTADDKMVKNLQTTFPFIATLTLQP